MENSLQSEYRKIVWRTPNVVNSDVTATAVAENISASGTHVTVHSINGPGTIEIKFDEDNASWISVEEGMVLTRWFNRLFIRDIGLYSSKNVPYTTVVLYISHGPLIDRIARPQSLRPGFHSTSMLLAANTIYSLQSILLAYNEYSVPNNSDSDGTFIGGPLLLKVPSTSAASVAVFYGRPDWPYNASLLAGVYMLDAGEWVSFDYSGRMTYENAVPETGYRAEMALCFAPVTAGATAQLRILANRRVSLTDSLYQKAQSLRPLV